MNPRDRSRNRTGVLEPLLDDPDPAIRVHAAYALATATDPHRTVRSALGTQFAVEQDPIVRAALVLAIAEAARAHPHVPTTAWMCDRLRDRTQAPEVRLAAAMGWLCLTDEPAPDDLHVAVNDLATDERAHAMDTLPWMTVAGGFGETGLRRCVREMLHPERPDPVGYDDPWAPRP
ncbi:HEAT repeat domain-containing protein [Streptomyces sp. NPDC006510]|uniref:HEAT repeat domain-containing protein n=1 Tax=Streptomyces sp. NPDC006510 TaxID=3155600 RepID=UPI0033BA191F